MLVMVDRKEYLQYSSIKQLMNSNVYSSTKRQIMSETFYIRTRDNSENRQIHCGKKKPSILKYTFFLYEFNQLI